MTIEKQKAGERQKLQTDTSEEAYMSEDTIGNLYTADGDTVTVSLCISHSRNPLIAKLNITDAEALSDALALFEERKASKDESRYPCVRLAKIERKSKKGMDKAIEDMAGSIYIDEYRLTECENGVYALHSGIMDYAIIGSREAWLEFIDNIRFIIRDAASYDPPMHTI